MSKKILIVDDEEEALVHLRNILIRQNFQVFSATTGNEGLRLARTTSPDLIILDIVMPDMDGADVASLLSEDPSTKEIPIIFLTGILTKQEELTGKKTGKHLVIAKPILARDLVELVNKTLNLV
jgi:DNA-binding response OmpR family regulator